MIELPSPSSAARSSGTDSRRHDTKRSYQAMVLANHALNARGSSKETRHLALDIAGSGLSYAPGDALGLSVPNDPSLVDGLIQAIGGSAAEVITLAGRELTLREALCLHRDVNQVTPWFLEVWGELCGSAELRSLCDPEREQDRQRFSRANHVLDVVRAYPVAHVPAVMFASALRRLQPRLYSIASSQLYTPSEAHLTIAVVRFYLAQRAYTGVASGHVAERLEQCDRLPVYVHRNENFRLPGDDVPVIMIGAETGVAPYRAFMQHREARGARGRSWLFFGERNYRTDFLYQAEWLEWHRKGLLSRIDVAFSHDQYDRVYIQEQLREQAAEVYAWLEEGAHVYVCGDAQRLAPAVHESLLYIVAQHRRSRADAVEYIAALSDSGRYRREVY